MTTAAHYDMVAKLLEPSVAGKGGAHCKEFVGDLEKQKAHVADVLKPVKAELAAVPDAMQKALTAMKRP